MPTAFSIDPDQGLSGGDELRLVQLAAELGYESAWTPSRADDAAFNRCLSWHKASGLPVGISAVPASGQPARFYADHARRLWDLTGGRFTLVVGSGGMSRAAESMRAYMLDIRNQLPAELPLYLAALGPLMIRLGGQVADGVAINWCTAEQAAWSRTELAGAASAAGRSVPRLIEYIRTAVDPDGQAARQTVGQAALRYALGPAAYRRHFERMGFGDELKRVHSSNMSGPNSLSTIGAAGVPGQARPQFERLGEVLDLPIVRILVVKPGDFESARSALEECRPTVD